MDKLIYYPSFEPRDIDWLKYALIYVDQFSPIIPKSGKGTLSSDFRSIENETDLVKILEPKWWQGDNAATKALKEGQIDVLVTAPINKYNIQSEDFKFPGHTDYLDKELEGDALMLMVQDNLRVGLMTDHIPVNEVAKKLTEELIIKKITIKTFLIN